jgi:hypothetical protein
MNELTFLDAEKIESISADFDLAASLNLNQRA